MGEETGEMSLPLGYYQFHKNSFINYQLNRWYALGYARKEDIDLIGKTTRSFADYVAGFQRLAEAAVKEHRLKNAAFYYRAAEFLAEPADEAKQVLYDSFYDYFYQAFTAAELERHKVAYEDSFLAALRLLPQSDHQKGTIVAFGGFDSCIEEFYGLWRYFSLAGYQVIAFDGPGQGATLRKHHLSFDHDWEKPTGAILDHFDLADVSLIGVSMGGYWAIRAAAFEKRVQRVIAFPPVYDWLELTNDFTKGLVFQLVRWKRLMNFLVRLKMRQATIKHTINHALFITRKEEPLDAVNWLLAMNKSHLHSELVDQDVMLLGGENDAFQPPKLLYRQKEALLNARSVTTRIFTKQEQAGQHCQMGNLPLALKTMTAWLDNI